MHHTIVSSARLRYRVKLKIFQKLYGVLTEVTPQGHFDAGSSSLNTIHLETHLAGQQSIKSDFPKKWSSFGILVWGVRIWTESALMCN